LVKAPKLYNDTLYMKLKKTPIDFQPHFSLLFQPVKEDPLEVKKREDKAKAEAERIKAEEKRKEEKEKALAVKLIVLKSHHKSIKERQQGVVNTLYDPSALQGRKTPNIS
jgi:hypothetical protein